MTLGTEAVAIGVGQPKVRTEDLARWWLFAILAGMLALPLVPGWQGLTRLLAAFVLLQALAGDARPGTARAVFALLGAGLLLWAASWIDSALSAPGRHVIGTLTDVFGLALPLYGGLGLLLMDAVLIFGLTALLWRHSPHRAARAAVAMGAAFWLASLSGPLSAAFGGTATRAALEQMLAGSSEWAVWVLFLCLCIALVRDSRHVAQLALAILLGGVLMAATIALQFAFADFAYVLDAARLEDYFYRARGTAYYHAPATYTVAIALMIAIGFVHGAHMTRARRLTLAGLAIAFALVISLNDTRGLNLALVGGLGLFAALMLLRRDWSGLILSLVISGIIGSNMIYMKPAIGGITPAPDVGLPLMERLASEFGVVAKEEPPATVSDKAPIIDGSLRLVLMKSGLRSIPDHLFVGSGIGNLDLVISEGEGYVFSSTYSSHTLYIDMALMAGLPALVLFLGLCALAFLAATGTALRDWRTVRNDLRPGLLAALVVLGIGAVFLPQEMNNIVALFFLFSALLLVASLDLGQVQDGSDRQGAPALSISRLGGAFAALLGVAVLGWTVLTSPTYTLPVLNLIARHAAEIDRNRAEVYVSTPLAVPLARGLLRLWGVQDPAVRLLPDDPTALPQDNAFIIWHPATDWRYPVLKASLPYRFIRPNSTAPSVEFPTTWWMLKSVPYAGFLLQAGGREAASVFAGTPDADRMPPDLRLLPDVGRFIGVVKLFNAPPRKGLADPDTTADDDASGVTKVSTVTFGLARNLTDANPSTSQSWKIARRQTFYFDMGMVPHNPVGAYRFIPSPITTAKREERMEWRLFGSDDLRNWALLDSRATMLGPDPETAPSFAIPDPRFYRYLMLVFEGDPGSTRNNLLGDIELFPTQLN